MNIYTQKRKVTTYIYMILGAVLIAVAVNMVYEPLDMVTGGVTGLAIVIKFITEPLVEGGVPIWLTNIILNIPLFIAAFMIKGLRFLKNTAIAAISLTIALYIIPVTNIIGEEYFLASVFGGVITGIGLGLVIAASASTGGTDLLGLILHHFFPHYTVPQLITIVDGVIVLSGAIVFGINTTLYAIIAVYITAKVSDGILEGLKFAKMAFIISDSYDEIAAQIIRQLDRGATGIYSKGMYSNQERNMLFCVVSKKEISKLVKIVSQTDPRAFVIVSDAREVMGEGFIEYKQ